MRHACAETHCNPATSPTCRGRTQPYLEALADEEQFMPADGMLLTVAEAADSSLLGARQPQL